MPLEYPVSTPVSTHESPVSTPAAVRYVECLSTLCVHDGRPVVANQNLIIELLIKVRATWRPAAAGGGRRRPTREQRNSETHHSTKR